MKTIEIDSELYQYIAGKTKYIGEGASSILRRLLNLDQLPVNVSHEKNQFVASDNLFTNLLNDETFSTKKSTVNRFMLLLSTLYNYNPALFSIAAASLHGSKRQYLAKDKASLELSGKNTKPREIIGTPYWVITNTNSARKIYIIESIMSNMGMAEGTINQIINAITSKPTLSLNEKNK